jgi:hypothetical protein
MALVLKDRVLETSNSSGTGTFTLDGAVAGFQTFSSAIGNTNTTYYAIVDDTEWEVGLGTVGAGTLARTTVYASSTGSKVNFSSGNKTVFCDYPASRSVNLDASGNVSGYSINGCTIDNTTIGATTPSTGAFTYASTNSTTSTTPALGYNASNSSFVNGATVSGSYLQNVMQNKSGTAGASTNFAVSNDLGTDSTYYGEFGMNSSVYSSGTPADFFSLNNGIYYSGHDGDVSVGSGNGKKLYLAWGTTGDKAHVINATGSIGLNTNITGTTNFGTSGQVLTSGGSAATPTWTTAATGSVTSVATAGTVNGITLTGGPITTTGTVTLGGTLDLSSPPAIGGTTPAAGTFTTITGQTEVLKGTGSNLETYSSVLTNAAWFAGGVTTTGSQSDPFGGSTAMLLNDGTTTGAHYINNTTPATITNNANYTFSLYAKAGTANYIGLYMSTAGKGAFFNLSTGAFSANLVSAPISYAITNAGSGWWRISIVFLATSATDVPQIYMSEDGINFSFTGTSKTVTIAAPQVEVGSTANTYIPTTSVAVYGTPTLSFSGVAGLGLQSDGSLYVSPAGTGALQAQATTSSTVGGNARGANAVDWQTSRSAAAQVASGSYAVIGGGYSHTANNLGSTIAGGYLNTNTSFAGIIGGGQNNTASGGYYSALVGGYSNSSTGSFNFIGGGYNNTGTAAAAVTTQSATMNGTTAVTLAASNAAIKVGQFILGTSIASYSYVAAISGTSLTLSQAASGSSTSTLSFYTPHGVVVGGGNNQATGSYSFIGGGGDAGTAANRNVASGDWSVVGGGRKNTASGQSSFVGSGGDYVSGVAGNTASGVASAVVAGFANTNGSYSGFLGAGSSNTLSAVDYAVLVGGNNQTVSGGYSAILGGQFGTTRSIVGNHVFPACNSPIAGASGVSQSALLILAAATTDATATVLRSNTSAASGTNQVILPNNSAYLFKATVIAGVTGAGDTKAWKLEGAIKRGAGVGTAAIVGTVTTTVLAADTGASTWTVTATADTTNGGLAITVTGQASTTIRWVCKVETTELTF